MTILYRIHLINDSLLHKMPVYGSNIHYLMNNHVNNKSASNLAHIWLDNTLLTSCGLLQLFAKIWTLNCLEIAKILFVKL